MFIRVHSSAVRGVDAYTVSVEVDLARGMPGFMVVGLPDQAVKESRDRVRAALKNNGFAYPMKHITVNLAPADIPKEGASFDLPIALGLLAGSGQIAAEDVSKFLVVGELALDGAIRPVRGVLSMSASVRKSKDLKGVIVPQANAGEAAVVDGLPVYPAGHLNEVIQFINEAGGISPYSIDLERIFRNGAQYGIDFRDVKGQEHVKRALEVAAAGSHNIILIGPPGTGKTMLAKRLPTVLPDLALEESLETTKVHSIAGTLARGSSLIRKRPFRAPHHTISDAGLVGGGTVPQPGEVSLSHNGVLFLDEVPEFSRNAIEVLREPLETGYVTISRVRASYVFPARFMLAAACNPCPCGYYGDPNHECVCPPQKIQRYLSKLSGPLLDRIDLHVEVPAVRYDEMAAPRNGETSEDVRQRVTSCREVQHERFARSGIFCNAHMRPGDLEKFVNMTEAGRKLLRGAIESLGLSARAYDRILKVARTIADLDGVEVIAEEHLAEAIQYRSLDRKIWMRERQAA